MRYVKFWILGLVGAMTLALQVQATTRDDASPTAAAGVSHELESVPDEPATLDNEIVGMEREYRHSLLRYLSASSAPRDWAVASLMLQFDLDQSTEGKPNALLERARAAAPDDAIVQWIALRESSLKTGSDIDHSAAAIALQRLEPDNTAVWMEDLAAAAKRKDSAAIDAVLEKMAASTHSDEHLSDFIKIQLEVYQRYPMPDAYVSMIARQYPEFSVQAAPYISSVAITAAVALPAYQSIVQACTITPASVENANRAAMCAAIGRLMQTRGTSLITNKIGSVVLLRSATYIDEDIRQARIQDWIYQQDASLLHGEGQAPSVDAMVIRMRDWQESSSELEAMRREIERAGIAPTPPADWADNHSALSPQRIRQNQLDSIAGNNSATKR